MSTELSLRLLPGECVVIEGADVAQLDAFADLCSGLIALRAGQVRFLGYDWSAVPHDFAAALRGRIGRVFASGGWVPFLDAETNILLPQLHHTRRGLSELQAEGIALAHEFGLPGLPCGRITDLSSDDVARAMLVRAFLGEPRLVLVVEPVAVGSALLNRVAGMRDRYGAIVLLVRYRSVQDAWASAATQWLRLTDQGLGAVRSVR